MHPRKISSALIIVALSAILGSGFMLPRVSAYVPIVGGALGLLLLAAVTRGRTFSFLRAVGLALLCGGPVLLSGLVNASDPGRLVAPTAFLLFAVAAYWVGRSLEPGDLPRVSVTASVVATAMMFLAVILRHWDLMGAIHTGNRFFADPNQVTTGMNPTVIGLMAMAIFLSALASRSLPFVMGMLFATGIMVQAASSRSALMTMLVTLFASRYLLRKRTASTILVGASAGIFLLLIGLSFFGDKFQGLANALFLVGDEHRGLTSGGSGRSVIWSYFYHNWLQHPIFGSGPGTVFEINGGSLYSHNMLLQILTDGGLVSLVTFGSVLVVALLASQRAAPDERRVFLTMLLAYLVYGIFEGRAINIGNPMSAYFYFVMFAMLGMTETVAKEPQRTGQPQLTKWQAIGFSASPPTNRY